MTAHVNSLAVHTAPLPETSQVGALIRAHRLRIGLTQRELADLSTISVRAIRDLEQGKARRPRPDTVRLMADALRLGPRARAALEAAAQQGRATGPGWAEPPAPPTALHAMVGRAAEAAALERELASGAERLVHVVGLTGVGKTRLALEVAERLHGTGMPVLWHAFPGAAADYLASGEVELAARVAAAAAGLFPGAQDRGDTGGGREDAEPGRGHPGTGQRDAGTGREDAEPGRGHPSTGPRDAGTGPRDPGTGPRHAGTGKGDPREAGVGGLAELLAEQPAVLVLDGTPAGPPRFDRLTGLLRTCPGLRLLVTSDQPWEIPGERIFLLSPLEVPAEGVGSHTAPADPAAPAVRVFLDHVRRVRPEFSPGPADLERAAWICRRLDGHPGALAAAASWLVVCDLDALCHSLDGDPVALLDHLGGGSGAERFRGALYDRLDRLPAEARELLAALCDERAGESFELADITALTGLGLPQCGRMLRELLISGTVRAAHEGGSSRFRVLGLVRAAAAYRAAGRTALHTAAIAAR
ncbi:MULTISPECIES: helix-turn-helix domain-containing protein [unclassified Streptomyces]|uniref:helix-turn-helix domain-containing protein n=1 Tax=unclassified Streptomyces TaxID=2593676 RepID=UPI00255254D5|nr:MULTISPECIES: helix-turn-helix domain-containing protein [unclassified Streptomyces]